MRHGAVVMKNPTPITYDTLRDNLTGDFRFEGIVWHHPDGRMAKLKRRDFPAAVPQEEAVTGTPEREEWRALFALARPGQPECAVERAIDSVLKDPDGGYANEIRRTAFRHPPGHSRHH